MLVKLFIKTEYTTFWDNYFRTLHNDHTYLTRNASPAYQNRFARNGAMYQPELHEELGDIERGRCFGLCKLENGKPVGYVVAKRTIDAYHLLTIAVDIEHRGKGYGSLLIDSIFAEIEKQGADPT